MAGRTIPLTCCRKTGNKTSRAGIKHALSRLCLGHQLLADALGGTVEPMAQAEVGIMPIELTKDGTESSLLNHCEPNLLSLQ